MFSLPAKSLSIAGTRVNLDPRQSGDTKLDGIFSLGRRRQRSTTTETADPTTTPTTTAINAYQKKDMRNRGLMGFSSMGGPEVTLLPRFCKFALTNEELVESDAVIVFVTGEDVVVALKMQPSVEPGIGAGRYLLTMVPTFMAVTAQKDAKTPQKAPAAFIQGHKTP